MGTTAFGRAFQRLANGVGWGFLARRKGASGAAALTMALALGANAVVFAVLDAFLLSSFALPEPDRLFVVAPTRELPGQGSVVFAEAWPNYLLIRETQRSFGDVTAILQTAASWDDGDEVRALRTARVTASFFPTTRVEPALGRAFTEAEEGPSPAPVVLVSHELWQGGLGGDPAVVGRTMLLGGAPHTVIGVMPPGFAHPLPTDVWLPFELPEATRSAVTGGRILSVWGRLADGVTLPAAVAEMADFDRRALEATPDNRDFHYTLQTFTQVLLPRADRTVLLVQAGSLLLVLLAVLNLSTVLVAWGLERRREMAVRLALGAPGRHVVGLLLAQGAAVVVAGAVGGLALAAGVLPLVASSELGPTLALYLGDLELDSRAMAMAGGVAAGAALLAGLTPAVMSGRGPLGASLRAGGRTQSLPAAALRWQKAMVVAQAGLTVVLLSAAALVGLGFRNLSRVDSGFEPGRLVVARVQMPGADYETHPPRAAFGERLLDALSREAGLTDFAFTSTLPVGDFPWGGRFFRELPGGEVSPEPLLFHFRRTSWNYHAVVGIPLLRGRSFDQQDVAESPAVAIVSRSLAEGLWPGEDAVGKPLYRVAPGGGPPTRLEVVGVAGDVMDAGNAAPPGQTVYLPWAQVSVSQMSVVVEPGGSDAEAVAALKRALREADPLLAAGNVATLESLVRQAHALPRLQTLLLAAFALIALGIVGLGSYGVMSQLVAARERELAVRLVFGAAPGRLGGAVLGQVLAVAAPGVVLGLAAVQLLGGALGPFAFGVDPGSPLLAAAVAGSTLAIVALATVGPARRATRQDVRKGLTG